MYLVFFFKDYLFLKQQQQQQQSLLGKKESFALMWVSKCYLLSCLTSVPSTETNILLPPCIFKTFLKLSVKSLGHFVIPLGFPFIHCFLRKEKKTPQVSYNKQFSTAMMRNITSSVKLICKSPECI